MNTQVTPFFVIVLCYWCNVSASDSPSRIYSFNQTFDGEKLSFVGYRHDFDAVEFDGSNGEELPLSPVEARDCALKYLKSNNLWAPSMKITSISLNLLTHSGYWLYEVTFEKTNSSGRSFYCVIPVTLSGSVLERVQVPPGATQEIAPPF